MIKFETSLNFSMQKRGSLSNKKCSRVHRTRLSNISKNTKIKFIQINFIFSIASLQFLPTPEKMQKH